MLAGHLPFGRADAEVVISMRVLLVSMFCMGLVVELVWNVACRYQTCKIDVSGLKRPVHT